MKRACLWMVAIGLFITVGVLTVEHAYAEGQHHEPRCTLKTLKGRYLFSQAANLLPPAFGITAPTPGNAAGFHIFNGDGTGTDIVTLRIGGATVFSNALAPFTYTVNADCTGSYTVLNGGPSFDLFIAPDGDSIAVITTGPPGNQASDISQRVSRQ
jgi:hypothetical protein